MPSDEAEGVISIPSRHSVGETIARARSELLTRGAREFALVDHSGEAERTGLSMPDTKVLLFGNPDAGTPVMLDSPLAALDLPLKLLIRQTAGGSVLISWTAPEFLLRRYNLPEQFAPVLAAAGAIARAAAE